MHDELAMDYGDVELEECTLKWLCSPHLLTILAINT